MSMLSEDLRRNLPFDPHIEELADEIDALEAELGVAMREASHLATGMWERHYKKDSPQFELCDSVAGIISQIDNMYAGVRNKLTVARAKIAELESMVPRPLADYHEDFGPVTWWKLPVDEPAWIGRPDDSDWPGYHTHFTPHPPLPAPPAQFNTLTEDKTHDREI